MGRIQLKGEIKCSEREGIMDRVRCPRSRWGWEIKDGQEHWPEVRGRVLFLMRQEREQMWGMWGSSCFSLLYKGGGKPTSASEEMEA